MAFSPPAACRLLWNVSKAAQLLDIQRTYLHEKMAALGIVRPE